jgi:Glucose / Sorbosone dehydrogenase
VRPILKLAALCLSLPLAVAATASAATLEPVGQFDQPIFVTSDPGNSSRLFVVERRGTVMEVDDGAVAEFADLTAAGLVSCCESERGLLSIALAPDFDSSGRFYAAYTGTPAAGGAEGDIHLDAFRHSGGDLLREPILTIGHAINPNHNGGQLQLGPDGYLYLSTGDGGSSGDPLGSGQSVDTLLGKILRIDPHPGATPAYGVPTDNPFVGQPGRDEIWSYGLRNPWRFSFDRLTGDLVIGDVGQDDREEVDFAPSPAPGAVGGGGANYGWNCREGFIAYPSAPESCDGASGFTEPVFDYPHSDPGEGKAHGCAIVGVYVVRDPSLGALYGRYLYADLCTGELRSLALPGEPGGMASGDRSEGLSVSNPVSFGEDSCGRLYVVSNDGAVYRLVGPTAAICPPPPASATGSQASGAGGPRRHGRRPRVRLRLGPLGSGSELALEVRVSPCAGNAGRLVRLDRGGHRFATKRLGEGCTARFRFRLRHRATFRALLGPSGGNPASRSRRLTVGRR